jgi:hypothetical protein
VRHVSAARHRRIYLYYKRALTLYTPPYLPHFFLPHHNSTTYLSISNRTLVAINHIPLSRAIDPQLVKSEPVEESDFSYGPKGLLPALKLKISNSFERSK